MAFPEVQVLEKEYAGAMYDLILATGRKLLKNA
jgi:hypothetical protein